MSLEHRPAQCGVALLVSAARLRADDRFYAARTLLGGEALAVVPEVFGLPGAAVELGPFLHPVDGAEEVNRADEIREPPVVKREIVVRAAERDDRDRASRLAGGKVFFEQIEGSGCDCREDVRG